jgi:hypothetical protein
MTSKKFWIGTVSKEHVDRGKLGSFAQVCHGKEIPLKKNDFLFIVKPMELTDKKIYELLI